MGSLFDDLENDTQKGLNAAQTVNTVANGMKNSLSNAASGADALGAASQSQNSQPNTANAGKDASKEASKDTGKDAAKDAGKEADKEAAKETGKEVAKDLAVEGAEALATGGTSLLKTAAKIAAKQTIGKISATLNSLYQQGDIESTYGLHGFKGAIIGIIFLSFIIIFGCFYEKETTGSVKNYSGNSFDETLNDDFKGEIEENFSTEKLRDYYTTKDNVAPLKDACDIYINGNNDGKGLKPALHDAITVECYNIINEINLRNLNFIQKIGAKFRKYDKEKSLEYFRSQPWPYDLHENGYPTVGDVLDGNYVPQYNDVNFLEMLTVLCQNEDYDWENSDYTEFNEFIRTKKAQNLYYELELKWILLFYGEWDEEKTYTDGQGNISTRTEHVESGEIEGDIEYNSIEEAEAAIDSGITMDYNGHTLEVCGFYVRPILKPFGLRELYIMAEVNPTDYHRDWINHTYYELLDRSEKLTHTYLREDADVAGVYYKDNRGKNSTIYNDLIDKMGKATGRSAWCYIPDEDTYNLRDLGDMPYAIPDYVLEYMAQAQYLPEGSNTLENFLQYFYHNQGTIQNISNQSGLCNFTSYMMIAMFHNNITMTDNDLASLAKKYCDNDGFFRRQGEALGNYHITQGSNIKTDVVKTIESSINAGNPLILHCRGIWHDNAQNRDIHTTENGHFMVVVGYGPDGIKVADPGKVANNTATISYDAINTGVYSNDVYVRVPEFTGGQL